MGPALRPSAWKLYNWHKWTGVAVLALSPDPPAVAPVAPPAGPARRRGTGHARLAKWAHGTHAALYALFFAVPLAGWAYSSAAGFPVVFLGLVPLPDFVPVSKSLADILKPIHATLAFALAGLVLVHVAAALKHQWIDNDGLLQRMLPGRR